MGVIEPIKDKKKFIECLSEVTEVDLQLGEQLDKYIEFREELNKIISDHLIEILNKEDEEIIICMAKDVIIDSYNDEFLKEIGLNPEWGDVK